MTLIYERRISTMIAAALRAYAPSMLSAASLACVHCGSKIVEHGKDGTVAFTLESNSRLRNLSRFKHVVVLTPDGKLSISCESSQSDEVK